MGRFSSLSARLVLTAVGLVVAVSILIGVAATYVIHDRLTAQVDDRLRQIAFGRDRGPGGGDGPAGPDTLLARGDGDSLTDASVLGSGPGDEHALSSAALERLNALADDGEIHQVDLPAVGTYRVISGQGRDGTAVAVGLPTDDVTEAVSSLIGTEVLLILLGGLLAAGGGLLLVRRQLRPLTEVAATAHSVAGTNLAVGDIDLSERVPAHLTDERTEVGQVGAALNTLLAHVESSLTARQASEQQVRQFVADASHELRTPLATIGGYAELARRRPDDAAAQRLALDKVEEESARMTSLVEDLLLLARLDAGRPLVDEPVDLTRLLLEAVSDARVLAPDHQWRLDLPAGAEDPGGDTVGPLEVRGDEQRLHQVVTNLLTNARKYTPAGTTITVVGHPDGFEVRDDGPGFPPALVEHAFERFARGDQARTREGGAGLGLALVEAIARSHGGTVELDSEPGDTRVVVRLPHPVVEPVPTR